MLRRLLLATLLATLLAPSLAAAQEPARSAVVELLDRITADINDLKYAEALEVGRALALRSAVLPVALRTRLHLLMAAAYFPEDPSIQAADSASLHLRRAIQLAPDAAYPAELRWRGLDSLLAEARSREVAVALRVPPRQPIGAAGAAARLPFVATANTAVELRVTRRSNGQLVHADTIIAEQGEFTLAAHDGTRIIVPTGAYDLVLTATRGGSADAVSHTHTGVVETPVLVLEEEPALRSESLLPESAVPARRQLIRTGLIVGAATAGLAVLGRTDGDLRGAFDPDPRAFAVGAVIAASVAWFARRDEVTPLPANVAANEVTRAVHARAVAAVRERNAARLANYTGTLVVVTDVP
jgi:hypothetical protein